MDATTRLQQVIGQEVFDYQALVSGLVGYRKPRDKITSLLASGDIIRIKKGLYVFGEAYRRHPISREWIANLVHGPSYVSSDYALAYHGLIPERVSEVTCVTTGKARKYATPVGRFSYSHLALRRYDCGFERADAGGGVHFLLALPEKALADKIWLDARLKATSLADVVRYLAEDLRVDEEQLRGLDLALLEQIDTHYASRKVSRLVRSLGRMRGART